jgi:DNA-binding transcriptional LysR family regulator
MNIGEVDLNLLIGFEALIRERNVSGAARRIHLSQPAMSNLLARLRKTFSDPLFERTGRRMMPTQRARQLAAPIGSALNVIREAIEEKGAFNPATANVGYTIATTDYAEALVLPGWLRTLKRCAPKITLHIKRVKGIFELPVDELDRFDFALGFHPLPLPPGAGLNAAELFQEKFVGIISKRNRLARQKFGLRRFLSLEHIRVNYAEESPGLIGDALQNIGYRRKVGLVVPHLMTVPFLAARSEMIGLVPERLAQALSSVLGLRMFEIPVKLPPLTMSLVWHERHQNDGAHRWFRAFVSQHIR